MHNYACCPNDGLLNRKAQIFACFLSAVAFGMMSFVCSLSYFKDTHAVDRFPYMVLTVDVPEEPVCIAIGLRATCGGVCGKPCSDQIPAFEYSTLFENCPLPVLSDDTSQVKEDKSDFCQTVKECKTGGIVTFACAILTCTMSLLMIIASLRRLRHDRDSDKNMIFAFYFSKNVSIVGVLCSLIAYLSMQWCAFGMENLYHDVISTIPSTSVPDGQVPNFVVSVSPGLGGALSVTSFVCLFIIYLLNICLPPVGLAMQTDVTRNLLDGDGHKQGKNNYNYDTVRNNK